MDVIGGGEQEGNGARWGEKPRMWGERIIPPILLHLLDCVSPSSFICVSLVLIILFLRFSLSLSVLYFSYFFLFVFYFFIFFSSSICLDLVQVYFWTVFYSSCCTRVLLFFSGLLDLFCGSGNFEFFLRSLKHLSLFFPLRLNLMLLIHHGATGHEEFISYQNQRKVEICCFLKL